jgi:hypothetical protein
MERFKQKVEEAGAQNYRCGRPLGGKGEGNHEETGATRPVQFIYFTGFL